MSEPIEAETERYLHDWSSLHSDDVTEIDPRSPGSLAAFQDAAEEQRRGDA